MCVDVYMSEKVSFAVTKETDLQFVIESETKYDNSPHIGHETINEHKEMLLNKDILHVIIRKSSNQEKVGYAILAGFQNSNKSIELRRIVINDKGKGYGRASIQLIKKLVFENFKAHRLWLDLKEINTKAHNLYMSENFSKDGIIRECMFENGKYTSLFLLSILKSEYTVDK